MTMDFDRSLLALWICYFGLLLLCYIDTNRRFSHFKKRHRDLRSLWTRDVLSLLFKLLKFVIEWVNVY